MEWDFGTCVEAVEPFFGDRSAAARGCVRHVKVAREIRDRGKERDYGWERFCNFVCEELMGLKRVDVTVWSSSGRVDGFPGEGGDEGDGIGLGKGSEERWREWEFVRRLLEVESLRLARVTCWGFQGGENGGEERGQGFDSWLARRMVGDQVVRERMLREGVVKEGTVVLNGRGT